jgi:dTDP-4-amino-4,6-dideoxygalactose transaminase
MAGPPASAVCFSFYATKTITTGEGGMICTDDEALIERGRIMALHGISKDAWKRYTAEGSWYYEIIAPGYKYNLTDIAAAMGLAQLAKAERMWQRRCEIAQRYHKAFSDLPELQIPIDRADCQHAWHLYILRLNLERLKVDRAGFIEGLKQLKIGASVHFIPLHLHPYYRHTYGYTPSDFPIANQEFQRVISLPIYSKMSDQDVTDVIQAVQELVSEYRIA